MEAAALGLFMVSACAFAVLLGYPGSPLFRAIPMPMVRQALGGIAMGFTAVAIISSPWGQRSGAHMNPALTLTFLSLGKIAAWDALFYIAAQFAGGLAGVMLAHLALGAPLESRDVHYAVTAPGPAGEWAAFWGEFAISFVLVMVVLHVANSKRAARYTPWVAGFLVATFITLEAPLSGMSMNPARTVGSALPSGDWTSIWLYFVAPTAAMFAAGRVYLAWRGAHRIFCAKFHHHNHQPCIFRCRYAQFAGATGNE